MSPWVRVLVLNARAALDYGRPMAVVEEQVRIRCRLYCWNFPEVWSMIVPPEDKNHIPKLKEALRKIIAADAAKEAAKIALLQATENAKLANQAANEANRYAKQVHGWAVSKGQIGEFQMFFFQGKLVMVNETEVIFEPYPVDLAVLAEEEERDREAAASAAMGATAYNWP